MTQHDNILFVPVPDGATFKLVPDGTYDMCNPDKMHVMDIPGDWRIIGTTDTMGDKEWKQVIEVVPYDLPPSPSNDFCGDLRLGYRDYISDEETGYSEFPFVDTATASGQTLLQSLGITNRCVVLEKNDV